MNCTLCNMCIIEDTTTCRVLAQHRLPKATNPWCGLTFPSGHVEVGESITASTCAMTCSKSSDAREYVNYLVWAERAFKPAVFNALPAWEQVSGWRGQLVAICDYKASYTAPNPPIWNEDYLVWWHLSNVGLLDEPIPCRGNVGMWRLPEEIGLKLIQGGRQT